MNMMQMMDRFGTEEKCRAVLEELRWPDGICCPRCKSERFPVSMNARNLIVMPAAISSQ